MIKERKLISGKGLANGKQLFIIHIGMSKNRGYGIVQKYIPANTTKEVFDFIWENYVSKNPDVIKSISVSNGTNWNYPIDTIEETDKFYKRIEEHYME